MKNKIQKNLLFLLLETVIFTGLLFFVTQPSLAAENCTYIKKNGEPSSDVSSNAGTCANLCTTMGYTNCKFNEANTATGTTTLKTGDGEYDSNVASGALSAEEQKQALANAQATTSTSYKKYILLESFPGFFKAGDALTDLPALILAIYKFGIWTVGIAGFFMLVVGGFMYMASAGNTATVSSARGIITDALLGILAALGAYLFLYVINPELVKLNITFISINVEETEGTPMGTAGVCSPLSSGDCSIANLTSVFGSKEIAAQASSICNGESKGKAIPSTVDICADGSVASWGLFQINITANSVGGLPCPSAFSGGAYTAKNHSCRVINKPLYEKCVTAALNPTKNIAAAKIIYTQSGNKWNRWGANKRSGCNFH